jgi:transcriptional regulator with XRE-family HTH domain
VDLPHRLKRERAYRAIVEGLVKRRKALGLTQAAVAKAMRVDQSYYSKWERLERELGLVDFVRLCRALRLKPEQVLKLVE